MNPWVLLGLAAAWTASVAGSFFYGQDIGRDSEIAGQARISKAIEDTREKAQQGAADAIAKNRPINQTIVQKAETVVREKPVYRDCRHDPDGLRSVNSAIIGDTSDPVGGGGLPKADAPK